jgi:hypothetical protein
MNDFLSGRYQLLIFGLMIAFVLGAILFILSGEFVRRRMTRESRRRKADDVPPQSKRGA